MRVPGGQRRVEPGLGQQRRHPVARRPPRASPCAASTSPMAAPIRIRGSRLLSASWNTICAARRYSRSRRPAQPEHVLPVEQDRPAGRRHQAQYRPAHGRLARAALPHQRHPERAAADRQATPRRPPAPGRSSPAGRAPSSRSRSAMAQHPVKPGHGGEQLAGVVVPGRGDDLLGRALLDHLPGAHDRNPVAQLGDHRQVVADEQDRPCRGSRAARGAARAPRPARSRPARWSARRRAAPRRAARRRARSPPAAAARRTAATGSGAAGPAASRTLRIAASARSRASAADSPCSRSARVTIAPTRNTGLKASDGLWKMAAIRPPADRPQPARRTCRSAPCRPA